MIREISVADRAHLALVDAFVAPTECQPGGEVRSSNGVFLVKNRVPFLWYNAVFRTRKEIPSAETLKEANDFFADRDYKVFCRNWADRDLAEECNRAGLDLLTDNDPYLVASQPLTVHVPDSLMIDAAPSSKLVEDFTQVSCDAFGEDDQTRQAIRDLLVEDDFFTPFKEPFVGYVDGMAVAAATVWYSPLTVGVYWVGTLSDYRHRGIGSAMVAAATNAAFSRGAQEVTLQTEAPTIPFYEQLGYHTVGTHSVFARKRVVNGLRGSCASSSDSRS
jgi:ribosomal protein S18 acetylase RimI-like enzyme